MKNKLPRLTKNNLNKLTSTTEIKSILNIFPKKKTPGSDGFIAKFYQTLMKETISILYSFLQNTEAEGPLPNSFYEANITVIPKLNEDITRQFLLVTIKLN